MRLAIPDGARMTDVARIREERASCAHLTVKYVAHRRADGYSEGWWACALCDTDFVPQSEIAALTAEVERLRDQLVVRDAKIQDLLNAHRNLEIDWREKKGQLESLADFTMTEVSDEPGESQGAVDTAADCPRGG